MILEAPRKPWSRAVPEILGALDVDPDSGLSGPEVRRRRGRFGRNRLRPSRTVSPWSILAAQFKSVIMVLLAAAAGLSFVFGQWVDGAAIAVAMVINAAVGFATELKATRSMEALRRLDRVSAEVRREGRRRQVDAEELVPGDVVVLEGGDVVTADLRLVESSRLQANESALTGESVPVSKQVEAVEAEAPLAERACMLHKGTFVTRGSALGVVVATGMSTEVGTIASLVEESEEQEDPLRRRLDVLGRKLVWLVLAIAALAAGAGLATGKALFLMIETAVALMVAAIPEGLAVVETVALARGMRRMAARRALVRRLSAVQTLGSTTVILTDKTGTLTENRMTVRRVGLSDGEVEVTGEGDSLEGVFRRDGREVDAGGEALLRRLLRAGVLCNNASLGESDGPDAFPSEAPGEDASEAPVEDPGASPIGDPLEVALLVAGAKGGLRRPELVDSLPEVREVAFDPELKMMATYQRRDGELLVAVKGAPDAVLERCTRVAQAEGSKGLDTEGRQRWLGRNQELAAEGFRVLALAERKARSAEEKDPYRELTFLGLAAMLDPPRAEVREAIDRCQAAGIRVVMATGDQAPTARAVGLAVGLIDREDEPQIEGRELDELEELSEQDRRRLLQAPVFYRVSPEQKLRLIELHRSHGSIVAMTGDGVNDAPALKRSDIGIAMGRRGQQVAKEAADVILQDDAFATIVAAVEHGRSIFENIRRFVVYLLSGNIGEILIVTVASLLRAPLPLLPLQILYLNAINDAFPALALGMGEAEPGIMGQPPRDPGEPVLARRHWLALGGYGALIAASVLGAFFGAWKLLDLTVTQAVTVSFLSLAFGRLWHVFNMRGPGSGLLRNQVVRNPWVWGALGLCSVLILLAVFVPFLRGVIGLGLLPPTAWALLGGASLLPLLIGQVALALRGGGGGLDRGCLGRSPGTSIPVDGAADRA